MLRRHHQTRTAVLAAADLAATTLALIASYLLRFSSGLFTVGERWIAARYLEALPPAVLLCVAAYAVAGNYRPARPAESAAPDLRQTVGGVLAAALLLLAGALLYRDRYQFSRGVLAIFPFTAVVLVSAGRSLAIRFLLALERRGVGVTRAVLLGEGEAADRTARELAARPSLAIRVVARIADPGAAAAAIEEHRPDVVFVAFPADRADRLREAAAVLAREMVDVRVIPALPDLRAAGAGMLGGLPFVSLQEASFSGLARVTKRAFDLAAGGVLAVALAPLLLLITLAVLLLSGRPLFYGQERMGLDGRRFRILKFRTMRPDAEADTGAVFARPRDPRCTRVGAFLRRFSLDELPQLLNVLKGEMSLVGPRPERPVFIEVFRERLPGYMLRHRIPAGLTGWAQVHGLRGECDLADRLLLDLYYLEHWSLLLDVEILLRTVWHVLSGRNAV